MVTAAALTMVSTPTARAPDPLRAARDFSFDAAVAATTRNAARALDIHGGAPAARVTGAGAGAEQAVAPDPATPARPTGVEHAPSAERQTPGASGPPQPPNTSAPPTGPAPTGATAANAGALSQPATAPVQSSAPAPGAIRDALTRIRTEAPRAPLPARAPGPAAAQFAEILARRLDGASQFDLRLDPPALGGIEGRLILSDDKEALLSLTFDNQSAFDLLRRDEAALRSALADAGFDLSRRNLQISFRPPAPAADDAQAAPSSRNAAFDPAPLHRGALDIRA